MVLGTQCDMKEISGGWGQEGQEGSGLAVLQLNPSFTFRLVHVIIGKALAACSARTFQSGCMPGDIVSTSKVKASPFMAQPQAHC